MSRVRDPDVASSNRLQIASLLDLTVTKLRTIQQRAEAKNYLDLAAALEAGVSLAEALGAAGAIYGKLFNAVAALKALTYFNDGNLPISSIDSTLAVFRIPIGALVIKFFRILASFPETATAALAES